MRVNARRFIAVATLAAGGFGLIACAPPQQSATPTAAPAATSAALPLARIEVREAQTLLTQLGYATGGADGVIGQRSTQAAMAYQTDMGMTPNGQFDRSLLTTLRASASAAGPTTTAAVAPAPTPVAVQPAPAKTVAAPAPAKPAPEKPKVKKVTYERIEGGGDGGGGGGGDGGGGW